VSFLFSLVCKRQLKIHILKGSSGTPFFCLIENYCCLIKKELPCRKQDRVSQRNKFFNFFKHRGTNPKEIRTSSKFGFGKVLIEVFVVFVVLVFGK
jgi:hypothetical protein